MKNKILLLAIGLLLPIVASAQLITSAQTSTEKEKKPEKPLHYEQSIEFTAATDFQDKGGDRSVYGLEYIGGIRFNNLFFLGTGIGLNFHSFSDDLELPYQGAYAYYCPDAPENLVSVPLYLHTRLYFTHTRCQPFFALSVGGQITGLKTAKGYDDAYYNPSCFMLSPQLGVNYQLNDKTCMYLTVGCLVRDIVEKAQYHNFNNPNQYVMNAVRSIGDGIAMKMSVGVTF
jgi:hypothetical protein